MDIYRTRFQIEFLLRDGKRYTGLTHCQSRQKQALAFHFNMSLSAINVVRALARHDKGNLSVANVKTLIHNAIMIHRFSVLSGKSPNKLLNTNDFKELLYYGVANASYCSNFNEILNKSEILYFVFMRRLRHYFPRAKS